MSPLLVQPSPDYRCSQGAARPAGADPIAVSAEARALSRAADFSGMTTESDGLVTLLVAVEPDAGMAQRVADIAQVPVLLRVDVAAEACKAQRDCARKAVDATPTP